MEIFSSSGLGLFPGVNIIDCWEGEDSSTGPWAVEVDGFGFIGLKNDVIIEVQIQKF